MVKTYKTAVDLWLALILIGVPLAIIATGVSIAFSLHLLQWHEKVGRIAGFLLVGSGLALGSLFAALTVPCRYSLKDTALHIQCGIFQSIIPYAAIRRLELSCSLWAAPALSLNRVKVVLDDGFHLISPKNRTAFIQDLQERLDRRSRSGS